MKKTTLFLLVLLPLLCGATHADISVKKSTFVHAEDDFLSLSISIAQNTRTGESLIAWQKTANDGIKSEILVRVINNKGKATTAPTVITNRDGSGLVSAAYNPVTNEYALVYDNSFFGSTTSGSKIFGRRLSNRGKPKGQEVVISNDSVSQNMSNSTPKIAFHPGTGGYAVVWLRNIEPLVKECGAVGTLLTEDLTTTGTVKVIRKTSDGPRLPVPLSIAFLPSGEKLLIVIRQVVKQIFRINEADYFLATLDPLLKTIRATDVAKINKNAVDIRQAPWHTTLAILPEGSAVVYFTDNETLKSRKIDTNGKLRGTQRPGLNAPVNDAVLRAPTVAFSTKPAGSQGLLLVNEVGGTTTWAQLLDAKGNSVGAPVQLSATSDETLGFGALTALEGNPSDQRFRFSWFVPFQADTFVPSSGILNFKLTVQP